MGLFGGIFKVAKKAVGGVAKAALSRATGGVSDIVLKKLKGRGQVRQVTAKRGHQATMQEQALVNKVFPDDFSPNLKQTETVLDRVGARAATPGYSKADLGTRKRRKAAGKAKRAALTDADIVRIYGKDPVTGRKVARTVKPKKAAKTKRTTPQGQKMKQLAAQWRAMGGQAGTGQTFFEWKRGR